MTTDHASPAPAPTQPPVLDLQADEADLAIYDQLDQATAQAARPLLREHLARLTAESAARLQVDDARRLQQFLRQPDAADGDPPAQVPAVPVDDATWQAVSGALAAFIASGDAGAAQVDDALADAMSQELAASLWSALLDRALPLARDGRLTLQQLLPDRPAPGGPSRWHDDLASDLRQFGLDADALVQIARRSLLALLEAGPATAPLRLPMGLWLAPAEALPPLRAALAQPAVGRPTARPPLAEGLAPMSTSQFSAL